MFLGRDHGSPSPESSPAAVGSVSTLSTPAAVGGGTEGGAGAGGHGSAATITGGASNEAAAAGQNALGGFRGGVSSHVESPIGMLSERTSSDSTGDETGEKGEESLAAAMGTSGVSPESDNATWVDRGRGRGTVGAMAGAVVGATAAVVAMASGGIGSCVSSVEVEGEGEGALGWGPNSVYGSLHDVSPSLSPGVGPEDSSPTEEEQQAEKVEELEQREQRKRHQREEDEDDDDDTTEKHKQLLMGKAVLHSASWEELDDSAAGSSLSFTLKTGHHHSPIGLAGVGKGKETITSPPSGVIDASATPTVTATPIAATVGESPTPSPVVLGAATAATIATAGGVVLTTPVGTAIAERSGRTATGDADAPTLEARRVTLSPEHERQLEEGGRAREGIEGAVVEVRMTRSESPSSGRSRSGSSGLSVLRNTWQGRA